MDAVFRFLFKYPLLVFQQGDFVLGTSRPMLLVLLVAAAIAAGVLLTYRSIASEGSSRDKAVLIGLRLALVAAALVLAVRASRGERHGEREDGERFRFHVGMIRRGVPGGVTISNLSPG